MPDAEWIDWKLDRCEHCGKPAYQCHCPYDNPPQEPEPEAICKVNGTEERQ